VNQDDSNNDWIEFHPLPSEKRQKRFDQRVQKDCTRVFDTKLVTSFFDDRRRACAGLDARLSKSYNIHFLDGIPR
jgi:hypothetical protein